MFYWGAAVVLVVSFVLLACCGASRCSSARSGAGASRQCSRALVLGPLRVVAQVLSVALFFLVWVSALVGDTDPFRNLAPTFVYVIFWLGLPPLTVVFGNVWRVLSPWRALADAFVWVRKRTGGDPRPLAAYPERLGRWPAAAGAVRVRLARARLPGSGEPTNARIRDRPLLLCRAGRDGVVRAGAVGRERGGVRGRVRASSPASRRSTWSTGVSACAGLSPGSPAPMRSRGRLRSSR